MKKIWYYIDLIEARFMAYSLLLTVILVFIQVCMRAFRNSLPWSEELARYIFIWQCWLGISFAERGGKHIRIEMLPSRLSPKGQRILDVIQTLLSAAMTLFLLLYGSYMVWFLIQEGTTSSALHLPMSIVYLSMPVSCLLYLLRVIRKLTHLAATGGSDA